MTMPDAPFPTPDELAQQRRDRAQPYVQSLKQAVLKKMQDHDPDYSGSYTVTIPKGTPQAAIQVVKGWLSESRWDVAVESDQRENEDWLRITPKQ